MSRCSDGRQRWRLGVEYLRKRADPPRSDV